MKRFPYRRENIQLAPFLPMKIGSPNSRKRISIDFCIDTGAEITVIPLRYISLLGLDPRHKVLIDDYDKHSTEHESFVVDLKFGPNIFRSVEVIVSESGASLLGLNVLNQLKLTLDGPNESLIIH